MQMWFGRLSFSIMNTLSTLVKRWYNSRFHQLTDFKLAHRDPASLFKDGTLLDGEVWNSSCSCAKRHLLTFGGIWCTFVLLVNVGVKTLVDWGIVYMPCERIQTLKIRRDLSEGWRTRMIVISNQIMSLLGHNRLSKFVFLHAPKTVKHDTGYKILNSLHCATNGWLTFLVVGFLVLDQCS